MVKYFQGGEEEAKNYTKSSTKKIYPICPDCGRVKDKPISIGNIYKNHSIGCLCGDGIAYPEKVMYYILKLNNIKFISQLSKTNFNWCSDKRYDFYLIDYNYIVETNGVQHYEENLNWKTSLKEQQENDKYKKELALNSGIDKYIVVDCRESNINFIKNNIINSELIDIINVNEIDWEQINKLASKNLIKEICEYYEKHKEITQSELSRTFNLCRSIVSRYLKLGEAYGWCHNVNERSKKARIKSCIKSCGKRVLLIDTNEIFESCGECAKQLTKRFDKKFSSNSINRVCSGKRKTYHNYHFRYVDCESEIFESNISCYN